MLPQTRVKSLFSLLHKQTAKVAYRVANPPPPKKKKALHFNLPQQRKSQWACLISS